jgi:poly(3-hydroxybutyrate) depolymerase
MLFPLSHRLPRTGFGALPLLALILLAPPSLVAQGPEEDPRVPPEVKVQAGDYAALRRDFRTHLVKVGPAPQKSQPVEPDASAIEVSFPSGGLTLKGWMSRPADRPSASRPAVLFLHGGFAFGPEDWEMTWPYRVAGFIVLVPMLRGENSLGGSFSMFYDEIDDVLAAAEFLAAQPGVDPKHLFLAGHSVGGTMALLSGMTTDRFRAVASFSGSPDQVVYCRLGVPQNIIPFDTTDAREFEVRSPMAYASSLRSPTRLYYGSRELHWDLTARRTVELARAKGLDVASRQVEGGHESSVPEAMALSIAFFNEVMGTKRRN